MVIHESLRDVQGAGNWDRKTGRYIPLTGGSRSRLPIRDGSIPRYPGFVGIDEHLTEAIYTMATLYDKMGGQPLVEKGEAGSFTTLLMETTEAKIAELEAKAAEQRAPSSA